MSFFTIFAGIVSIVGFLGISGMIFVTNKNISKILEHNPEVLFGYYSKMKVYLLELKVTLGQEDETPLLVTLSNTSEDYDSVDEDDDSVKKLQGTIDKIIEFFKTQDWQIPLDFDFENKLSQLMIELMYLEKGNLCRYNSSIDDVKSKYNELIRIIDDLTKRISKKQMEIDEKVKQSQETMFEWIKRKVGKLFSR